MNYLKLLVRLEFPKKYPLTTPPLFNGFKNSTTHHPVLLATSSQSADCLTTLHSRFARGT